MDNNTLNNKDLDEKTTMNYSYIMGVSNIEKLKENGFEIKQYGSNYGVSFPHDKSGIFEEYIYENLQNGFWNEYIGNEIVFIFKFRNGNFKRYVLNKDNEKEILNLCEKFANCKFESIDKMLKDNNFYKEKL